MVDKNSIRWLQRFDNFEKAYKVFLSILEIENPNMAEKMGLIHSFEVLFELAWKTMKDYLFSLGYDEKSPRDTIKQAFQNGIVSNGHVWMDALNSRNETSHLYDDFKVQEIETRIREEYSEAITELYNYFNKAK